MNLRPQTDRQPVRSRRKTEGGRLIFVSDEPIAALFDSFPVENHARRVGRLGIDDPEGLADTDPVAQRKHGNEMASRIIRGDFTHREPAAVAGPAQGSWTRA
jgi:hypothetical protein